MLKGCFMISSDSAPYNNSQNGTWIRLTAEDGHSFDAFEVTPANPAAAIVVLQEIFGVNDHIRTVCRRFAQAGYRAIAPALFDRQEVGFQSGYSQDEVTAARRFLNPVNWDGMERDVAACATLSHDAGLKVAAVGFCLGGSVAFRAAVAGNVDAAISYYGGQIASIADRRPVAPTLLHFGDHDHTISLADIEHIRKCRPELPLHLYAAGHGFNCDVRDSFDPDSARLAWKRSLDFLHHHLRELVHD